MLVLSYSCEKEEKKARPSVTSSPVTSITNYSAVSGGIIKDDGGSSIISCGVVWDTLPGPDIQKSLTNDSLVDDSFISEITGLQSGTKYYVRAYATNSVGTSYGEQLEFITLSENKPVVKTLVARFITSYSAVAGGEILDSGMQIITNKGICWQTSTNPTVADSLTDEGAGSKDYLSKMTGLSPGTTYYYRAYAINQTGTGYGDVKRFTTPNIGLPVVKTTPVSSVNYISAISGGEILDTGLANIDTKGVCWSIAPFPTLANDHTDDGSGPDLFVSTITGLFPGTTYYCRAYATNAMGTSYGEEMTFQTLDVQPPAVITDDAADITATSAACSGSATSDTFNVIQVKGICYALVSNPSVNDFITDEGPGSGSFSSNLTGLTPDTAYFIRAYAITPYGTYYGNEKSFKTENFRAPVINTIEASSVTYTSAISGGEILDTGYLNIVDKGVCWNTSPNPTISNNLTHDGVGSDAFVSALAGLSPATTYYYRAYATNDAGTAYGDEMSFQTPAIPPPDIITNDATNIAATSAECSGSVSSDTINPVQIKGICYSLTADPLTSDLITDEGAGTGSFSSIISGLSPGTTYFIRAYAITPYGTYYGNEKTFTTNDTLPEVVTVGVTEIKALCAKVAGSVLSDGGDPATLRGFCWSESAGPTLSDQVVIIGSGIGDYTGALNGLNPSTTYYVRSFATNSVGNIYGNELTFITKDPADWVLAFSDDFESYATGTHPSENWETRFSGDDAEISEDVAYEGIKSFMLSSKATWARVEAVPLVSVPDYIIYEGAVYVNQAGKGCAIGFGFKENASTYRTRNAVHFDNNGKIAFGGELQDWTLQTWYNIKVECDFTTLKGKIWINDILVGSDIDLSDKSDIKDFMIMGLNFPSGAVSKAYFDNIKIYVKGIDQPTCD
ncbi:hypothetical protein AC481_07005 [miscellaneous Crenarchaeota group archaeon SMTZ-80]|nr:MAG: hypothetical protein AC481_07005 [miscellaneous Crenarchaeota group archaeon SMTZ-80]